MVLVCILCNGTARIRSTSDGVSFSQPCPRCRGPKRFKANGTLTLTLADGSSVTVCVAAGDTAASATTALITALQANPKGTP